MGYPVQKPPTQAALGLIAHKHHGALLTPQVVLEVVADTPGVTHARGRDDDLGVGVRVQSHGLLSGLGDVQAGELEQGTALQGLNGLFVQIAVEIAGENPGSGASQGGVHIHLKIGNAAHQALLFHLTHKVQKLLGAAHRKGGDDDISAFGEGLVNESGQISGVVRVHVHVVEAVPVGALRDHIVRFRDKLGVPDDGLLPVANVPGEDDLFGLAVLGQPQLGAGRAQQVPGVGEAELDVVIDLNLLAVFTHHQVSEGALHIGQGVQGLHRGTSGPLALLVFPLGVTLLDVGGVPQHNVQQLGGEAGAVDVAAKSLLDEQGNAAGVVNVGVGDNDVLNVAGHEVQLGVVDLIPPLLQAAVNEHLVSVALHTVAAAGDGFG